MNNPKAIIQEKKSLNKMSYSSELEESEEIAANNKKKVTMKGNELLKEKLAQIRLNVINIQPKSFFKYKTKLPLARIKRIMKIDNSVRMISAETLITFSKACEMFIIELACKSFVNALEYKRRTIQKGDLKKAINSTEIFDFLIELVDDRKKNIIKQYSQKVFSSEFDSDTILKSLSFPSFEFEKKNILQKSESKEEVLDMFLEHYNKFKDK